jgi:hypothetical protein
MNTLPIEIIHKIQLYAIDVGPAKLIYNMQKRIRYELHQYPELYNNYKQAFDGKGVWNFQCIVLNELLSLLDLS